MSSLAYSFLNEDPMFETAALPPGATRALAISGSGFRAALLLAQGGIRDLTVLDRRPIQLAFARVVFESFRRLDYAEFVDFWDPLDDERTRSSRRALFYRLRQGLAEQGGIEALFEARGWASPLYFGKHEQRLRKLGELLARLRLGPSRTELRPRTPVLALFSLAAELQSAAGMIPKRTDPRTAFRIYSDIHENLRALPRAGENFFLQQLLWGKAHGRDAFMGIVSEQAHEAVRAGIGRARIGFECSDLTGFLAQSSSTYEFFSLSNITSYLSRSGELELLSALEKRSSPGAVAVVRSFLRLFEPPETRWRDESASFMEPMRSERTQAYRIHVLRLRDA